MTTTAGYHQHNSDKLLIQLYGFQSTCDDTRAVSGKLSFSLLIFIFSNII